MTATVATRARTLVMRSSMVAIALRTREDWLSSHLSKSVKK